MAQQNHSEFTERELRTLLERFCEVIVRPHSFQNDDFDIINFHETQNFEDHSLGKIVTMLEKYNANERSILEILYDHLIPREIDTPKEDGDSEEEEEEEAGNEVGNEPQYPSNQQWSFNNTFLLMEHGLKLMMEDEQLSPEMPEHERDEMKKQVLKWSVELWFLGQVSHCKNVEVSRALQKITNELFEKYMSLDFGRGEKCRLTILRKKDCTDLVETLLTKGDFGIQLKRHLDNSNNFKEFNKTPMSRPMIKKISPHSSMRYIIPKNGHQTRAYGFYVTGVFLGYSAKGRLEESSEYRKIKEAYERSGLYSPHFDELLKKLPLPTEPKEKEVGWDAEKLCTEIERCLKKIEEKPPTCSLLFFALPFHGFHEHVRASNWTIQDIKGLLVILQRKKLEGIPKVVIIQACQEFKDKKECTLQEYVEKKTNDTTLVMTSAPGDESDGPGIIPTYLEFFARYLRPDGETSIDKQVKKAAEMRWQEFPKALEKMCKNIPEESKPSPPPKSVHIHKSAKKVVILPKPNSSSHPDDG